MKTNFTEKEHLNSGLAFLLLLLIIGLGWHFTILLKICVVVVLILLTKPVIFYPFTFIWLNLSDGLGKIMSKIILSLIFFVIVFPTAIMRRIIGKDTLMLKQFKKSNQSVFVERNHVYSKNDLINPF
jgi:hypothetical protein